MSLESDVFPAMDLAPFKDGWIAICGKDVIDRSASFSGTFEAASRMIDPSKVLLAPVPQEGSLLMSVRVQAATS